MSRRTPAENGSRWARRARVWGLLVLAAGALLLVGAGEASADAVHGPYSLSTDQCATCHRTHAAPGSRIIKTADQPQLCLSCHDGTGATVNVSAQFAVGLANDAATRSFYKHDPAQSVHTLAIDNEFGGVMNRHSTCSDCHNPHRETNAVAVQNPQGTPWKPSGRLARTSGVLVSFPATAGTAPTYTFVDGESTLVFSEYEVCLKCHSGFTQLLTNTGFDPSKWTLDKGIDINPANTSYHPVVAAGKNKTAKMTASLSGTSQYRKWTFTTNDTVRCTNCHAGAVTPPVGIGGNLPTHGSANRGMLLAPYRDRLLKVGSAAYSGADFQLCFLCHSETPFNSSSTTDTNFRYHQKHVAGIPSKGTACTDSSTKSCIDTPGAGNGNAICSECHFRLHSTALATTTASTGYGKNYARLVNFSPNVTAANSTLSWTSTGTGTGSCTLTCHGVSHTPKTY